MIDRWERRALPSTMGDKNIPTPSIRVLVQALSEKLDAMSDDLRAETIFADVRPSDAKAFFVIAQGPRKLTDLAGALRVSRQVAHRSVQRLQALGVIDFDYAEGSKRDMVATLTEKGREARVLGRSFGAKIDQRITDEIGLDQIEHLRTTLKALNAAL